MDVDRVALRHQAVASARASLGLLAATFANSSDVRSRLAQIATSLDRLDHNATQSPTPPAPPPARPASGSVFGITTVSVSSQLNTLMLQLFRAHPSRTLTLRLVVFEDEVSGEEEREMEGVVVLSRPPYLPWPHLQCTSKILRWFEHALVAFPRSHFIGQMDSDTWINPPRLSRFLAAIEAALPADAAVWGGLFEHWERLDTNQTINCIGFSYDSPGKVSAWPERDPRILRRSEAEKRKHSFAMAQGGLYFYSRSAATRLIEYVKGRTSVGDANGVDRLAAPPRQRLESLGRRHGPYREPPDPCDAIIGWLGARAFTGVQLYTVSLLWNVEYYIWPMPNRFNAAHGLVVHQLKLGDSARELKETIARTYEARVGNASRVRPEITCRPVRWLHARSAGWKTCTSTAP